MMIVNYKSKKELKEHIGQELDYTETSMFGTEFVPNGTFCGCNRPNSPEFPRIEDRKGREFFASITTKDGKIDKVT